MVPTAAFKPVVEAGASDPQGDRPAGEPTTAPLRFRSSGTTLGEATRSVHINPFPDLYRSIIDVGYTAYCLSVSEPRPPTLSLIPSLAQISDSSLGFMAEHILQHHAAADSVVAFSSSGVDLAAAIDFLERRQVDQRPAMVLTTAFALVELLDHLELRGASQKGALALPAGSSLFETGGFKGRSREITRNELVEGTTRILRLPAHAIVREYGMTELTSQMYSASLLGGDPDLLRAPPWLAVSVFDPATLEPAATSELGLIGFFDLGNVGSYAAVLTEDLGRLHREGLELVGRASQAELRGCSLTVEELQLARAARAPQVPEK
jgi:hypothetical protein